MCIICFATQVFDPARHDNFQQSGFAGFEQNIGQGVSLGAVVIEQVDAAEVSSTAYTLNIGDMFEGTLSNSTDEDWIAIEVAAGTTYDITMTGQTLSDSYVTVYGPDGGFVAGGGSSTSPQTNQSFTATQTGTYFIEADAWSITDGATGTYTLSVDIGTTPSQAAPGMVGTVGTIEQMANYLTEGFWNGAEYTFDTSASNIITVNIAGLTAIGQKMALWATQAWEAVADLSFSFVTSGEMITLDDEYSGAYAWTPGAPDYLVEGGVELNIDKDWVTEGDFSYSGDTINSYAFETYVHEFGHALGLGHQGDYNFDPNGPPFGYDNESGVVFTNDSTQLSVMSYLNQTENTSTDASFAYAVGPMMVDIFAIQDLYGAPDENSATAGDTTYGEDTNLTNYMGDVFNWLASGSPDDPDLNDNPLAFTVYDAGGIDTFGLGFLDEDVRLDLGSGSFSDIGDDIGVIGIAVDTVIENAVLGRGADTVTGNDANNTLTLGAGRDTAFGGAGDDHVLGGEGLDTLYGGAGNDTLDGEDNTDALHGGEGDDMLIGGTGFDNLYGDAGDDQLFGGSEADRLFGGAGDDTLRAGSNFGSSLDGVSGGDGDDTLFGDAGFDVLRGDAGNDYLDGGNQADNLFGGTGTDEIYGGGGFDRLFGGSDDDVLYGGASTDGLFGGSGNDDLYGGTDEDRFFGGSGDDMIYGGDGDDWINGAAGFDTIDGGAGTDTMLGGFNADTFIFADGHGNDTIIDFEADNNNEKIDLTGVTAINSLGDLNLGNANSGAATQSGADVLIDTGGGNLITLVDVDLTDLGASDFIF